MCIAITEIAALQYYCIIIIVIIIHFAPESEKLKPNLYLIRYFHHSFRYLDITRNIPKSSVEFDYYYRKQKEEEERTLSKKIKSESIIISETKGNGDNIK